jgi:hypothetical protein
MGVFTEQPQDVLGLGPSGDALGGEIGPIRVDRQQRHFGDGGMISGSQRYGWAIERRRSVRT